LYSPTFALSPACLAYSAVEEPVISSANPINLFDILPLVVAFLSTAFIGVILSVYCCSVGYCVV
jgi:hypothetical protein